MLQCSTVKTNRHNSVSPSILYFQLQVMSKLSQNSNEMTSKQTDGASWHNVALPSDA